MTNVNMRFRRALGLALVSAALVSCGRSPDGEPSEDSSGPPTTTPAVPSAPSARPAPQAPPPPPWSAASLRASDVPPVYRDVWRAAPNRQRCALLAPARLSSKDANANARAATFSGGWAVAYDAADQRSAFGIAGSATNANASGIYDRWPHRIIWADSSRAEYGLEGGTGPNWLAYVRVRGQECLYNVWSRRGREHLEELLGSLRFVSDG